MGKNAPYIKHDSMACADPDVVFMIEDWSGGDPYKAGAAYGWYWMLNEVLHNSKNAEFELERLPSLVRITGIPLDILTEFIQALIHTYRFYESDGTYFWSNRIKRDLRLLEKARESGREGARRKYGGEYSDDQDDEDDLRGGEDTPVEDPEPAETEGNPDRVPYKTPLVEGMLGKVGKVSQVGEVGKERARGPTPSSGRLDQAIADWNTLSGHYKLPRYRFTAMNCRDPSALLRVLSNYTAEEVKQAIMNYGEILQGDDYEAFPVYAGFEGFIAGGVEKYAADAMPFDRCRIRGAGPPGDDEETIRKRLENLEVT